MKAPGILDARAWVEEHRALLPRALMSHERVWNDGFLVMLFDGPTAPERSDFHVNSSPEFFYQFVGEMFCRVLEDGRFVDYTVKEGEMFLLPAGVPHLNRRGDRGIGLVVHQARPAGAKDAIVWYCENCGNQLHRVDYLFEELKSQLTTFVTAFLADERLRTCARCGTVMPGDRGRMT
ncbi:MAG TPA: 3-hydroxyanthranilate 3,4-dioxygenase [Polyangiaceae bacterium]|nr:3-hydroxyanthranilate 3,4-dioxygenase [Polyangiaceae bacterium]